MTRWWAVAMLLSGGLFAGGVASIAWERIPAWRAAGITDFRSSFADTLRRVDRLQPALLGVCLVSTVGFASVEDGRARTLALLAAFALLVILVGSVTWLVPMQRRMSGSRDATTAALQRWRVLWLRGHVMRTVVAVLALSLAVIAVTE